ncbi:unnamed protein product [Closterium sp. NIES-65]|nr:unnamed protein product [Closterium sp. NIES-65]
MAASLLASALFLLSSLISAILFSPHSPPLLLALPGEVRRIFLPALVPSAIARASARGGWVGGRQRLGLPSFIIAADGAAHPSLRMVPPAQSDLPAEAVLGEAVSGARMALILSFQGVLSHSPFSLRSFPFLLSFWGVSYHSSLSPSFVPFFPSAAAHPSLRIVPPAQSDLPAEALLGEAVSGAVHGTPTNKRDGSRPPLSPAPDASLADAGVGGLGEGGRGVGVVLPAVDVSAGGEREEQEQEQEQRQGQAELQQQEERGVGRDEEWNAAVERAVEEAVSDAFSRAQFLLASLDSVRRAGRAAQKAFSDRSFVALVEEELVLHFGEEEMEGDGEGGQKISEKGLRGVDVDVGGRVGEEARRRAEAVVRTVVVMMGERGEEGVESSKMGAEGEEEEGEGGEEAEEGEEEGGEGAAGGSTGRRFRLAERLKGLGDVARDKVWDMADSLLSRLRAAGQKVVSAEEFLAARARYAAARVHDAGKRVLDRVVESGRAAREDAEAARDARSSGRKQLTGAGRPGKLCGRAEKKTVGAVEGGVKGAVEGVREVVEGVEEAVKDVSERVKGVGRCVVEEGFLPHTHGHGHGHGHKNEEAGAPSSPAAPTAFLGPVYDVATEAVRMEHGGEGEWGEEGVGEGAVGQVGSAWDAAKGRVEEGAENLRSEMKEGAEKLQEEVKEGAEKLPERLKEGAEKLPERVKEGAEGAWEEARERGSKMGEKVKEGAEKAWEEVREEGSRVGGKMREKAEEGWEAVEGAGEKMREGVRREGGGEGEEGEMGDGVWMELQGVRFFQPVRDAVRPKKADGKETATGEAAEAEGTEGAEQQEQMQQWEQWERVNPPFPSSALMSRLPLWFQRLVLPIPLLSHLSSLPTSPPLLVPALIRTAHLAAFSLAYTLTLVLTFLPIGQLRNVFSPSPAQLGSMVERAVLRVLFATSALCLLSLSLAHSGNPLSPFLPSPSPLLSPAWREGGEDEESGGGEREAWVEGAGGMGGGVAEWGNELQLWLLAAATVLSALLALILQPLLSYSMEEAAALARGPSSPTPHHKRPRYSWRLRRHSALHATTPAAPGTPPQTPQPPATTHAAHIGEAPIPPAASFAEATAAVVSSFVSEGAAMAAQELPTAAAAARPAQESEAVEGTEGEGVEGTGGERVMGQQQLLQQWQQKLQWRVRVLTVLKSVATHALLAVLTWHLWHLACRVLM